MESILTIQTPTGYDMELRIAGPGGRSYAFVIDWHIRVLAALAWFFTGTMVFAIDFVPFSQTGQAALYLVWMPSLALYFLYHPVLEVLMQGRTPGKRIAGVRLVNQDGGVPGVGALLIRNLFRLIDCLPFAYCVGLATAIMTKQSVRIGDLAAGTVLVYDETQKTDPLGGLSDNAVARIGLESAKIVRDLLVRWDELDPDVRSGLAQQLLEKYDPDALSATDVDLHAALQRLIK